MKKNRFITGYSGLRALAVIGVILYHLDPNIFVGGYLGVPIFFVLTGYLITDHVFRSLRETNSYNFKRFYLSRLKRLYPQLITVLWLSSSWILLFQRNLLPKLNQIVTSNLLNVYNIWQIHNGQSYFERFAANQSPFTHLWTMSLEGQFYIFWPIVLFLLYKYAKSKKIIVGVFSTLTILSAIEMAVLFVSKADINRIYYGTDTRFFALGLGALLAVLWPIEELRTDVDAKSSLILDVTGLIAFVGMMSLFFTKAMNAETALPYLGGMFIFTVLVTVLVGVIAHPGSHWNRWLTNPVFNWIGSRSYGIYLYQFPVMIFFEDKFQNIADHPVLYRVIELAMIIFLSEFTYRMIEKPFAKLTFKQAKAYFKQTILNREVRLTKKIPFIFATLIIIVGSIGIGVSPHVKGEDFNKSQLAQRIKANSKKQAADNKKIIDHLKKEKKKKKQAEPASEVLKQAKIAAKKNPINQDFEKYGISQVNLQLAKNLQITAIGDSVMAGSSDNLKTLMPKSIIDAAVSRQVNVAFGLLTSYANQGVLANNVLIGLGTNGPFPMSDVDHLMQIVGPNRHVFWINTHVPTRPWQGQVNSLLAQAGKKYKNLTIIDWYDYSASHPKWFYQDKTHPTVQGSKFYSTYIVNSIIKKLNF
ncbi:acyltransferase family protein [Lactobacillus pasteurii]|uniref:Acyltransferase 3 domain-containing protein n=1 Tax=Lactobacillus pasteurii DSM 23907 = CRBIP 24.76 TaxID=1423790 RepID=I7LB83_9LACO|nr:acyltransferase family protein [Lactobacillus pasteurii]TDG76542.1 hypothetical protein C5L33_001301 [Lactobacillus pasteurii]CCI85366.1 Putative uncharacterized protein [Lactobacillus pasteurii DSM 23907 = CRBIP 24.76]